ncbi:Ig-like domain-containing protein [Maricaulis sp.]|uniref:Ig-like domain-containing protein n=1 Tax=Maricaulis sp. TaxID=1486257 RepID=UPI003A8DE461
MIGFGSAAFGRLVRMCRGTGAKTVGLVTAMLAAALIAGAGLTPGAEASDPAPRLLSTGGPTYTNADSFTASIQFNANVRNVDPSDFEVIGSTATITGWTAVSASYYWADVSGGDLADMNGEVWVRLKAGQDIESLTGVALTDLNTVSESPITIDNTVPECAFATTAAAPVTDVFTVSMTCAPQAGWSDIIVAFTQSDLVVGNAVVESFSFPGAYSATFTLRPSSTGTVTVDLPAGSLYDDASNPNPAAPQFSIAADLSPPTVLSIERDDPSDETTNEDYLWWRVTFSKPVTGVDATDFSVTGSSATVVTAQSAGGNAWNVRIGGGDLAELEGVVSLGFSASQDIEDTDGRALVDVTPSGSNENSFDVSNTAPVLAHIRRMSSTTEYTNATELVWDFQYSSISRGYSLPPEAFEVRNVDVGTIEVVRYSVGFYVTASGGDLPTHEGYVYIRFGDGGPYPDEYGNNPASYVPTGTRDQGYTLDRTAPVVSFIADTDTVEQDGAFTVVVQSTERLVGLELDEFIVGNGTATALNPFGHSYIVTIRPEGDGLVTVDLPAGAATDPAGNGHAAPEQVSYLYDFTAPRITDVELVTAGGSPTNSDTLTWEVTFSEAVENVSADDFYLSSSTAAITSVSQSQPDVYLLEASGGDLASLNSTVLLSVVGYDITDTNGNYLDRSAVPTGANEAEVVVDNTAPTPQLSVDSDFVGADFILTVTFDEAVAGFTASDLTLTNATAAEPTQNGNVFSFAISPLAEGEVTISIAAGVAEDQAGNGTLAGDQTLNLTSDQAAPVLTSIERAAWLSETTNSDTLTWIVTFSEPVANLDERDFGLDGTTARLTFGRGGGGAGEPLAAASQSQPVGEAVYQLVAYGGDLPSLNGVVTLSILAGNDITDYAGQRLVSVTPTGANEAVYTLVNDVIAPTVVLSSAETGPVSGPFTLDIVFSEDVIGLELRGIVVGNGTATDFSGGSGAGNAPRRGEAAAVGGFAAAEYTVTITPTADGDVTVDLEGGAARDLSGNPSQLATQFVIAADLTAPTVVLSTESADPVSGAFALAVTFSEDISGLALEDLVVGNGAASDLTGSGADYSVTITPAADGDVTVDLAAGAAQDAAGNESLVATQFSISTDGTAPSVVLSSEASEPAIGAFALTVAFSEDVTGLELEDFVVVNADLSDLTGSGAGYELTVTPTAGSPVTVDLPVGAVIDAAGNANLAAEQFSIITDNTPPTLAITLPGEETEGPFIANFTFSEDVTGFELDDIGASNADLSEFTTVSASEYTALVTPQTIGTIEITVDAGVAEDAAGNGNEAASASIDAVAQPIEVEVVLGSDVEDPTDVTATAAVTNPGSQPVEFRTEADVDWLDVDPLTGTIPAFGEVQLTITVNALANDLPAGTYTGTVTVINLSGGGAAAKGPNAETRASGDSIVVAIPLTVSIAERRGTIQLVSTTPGGVQRDATFEFASSDTDLDQISLTTAAGYAASSPVRKLLGQYDVIQSAPDGWRLDSITCTGDSDSGSVIDLATGRVDIDLDANESIVCTFANTRDETEVRLATQRAIRNFMVRRGDRLLSAAPDLTRRVRDRDTSSAGQFSADINGGNRMVSLGTSMAGIRNHAAATEPQMPGASGAETANAGGADIWLAANYSAVSDDRSGDAADSAFGVVQLGIDWAFGDSTVAGLMVQHDWADETTDEIAVQAGALRGARVSGSGWMAGPYLVQEIGQGAWLDVLALYGKSDNRVDPLGLYEDSFETTRFLIRMNLSGEWQNGAWRVRPSASLAHFQETQDAYFDTLGIDIPEQTIAIGRMQAGPEFAYRIVRTDGGWWEPSLGLTGVWDYNPAELLDVNGQLVGTGGLRANAKLGLRGQLAPGASIAFEADIDGLGDGDFEARSARIELRLSFN